MDESHDDPLEGLNGSHAVYLRDDVNVRSVATEFPPPPSYVDTFSRRPIDPDVVAQRLNHILDLAWETPFYRRHWGAHGIDRRDITGRDDLSQLPPFDVDDLRESLERAAPWGDHHRVSREDLSRHPYRVYFSGGTTGMPRPAMYSVRDRDIGSIMMARTLWMQGVRPGDIALVGWSFGTHQGAWVYDEALYKWLGCLVIPTSTGNVTPSLKQLELAARFKATTIMATSDYLVHLATVAREAGYDLERDFAFKGFSTIIGLDAVEQAWNRPAYNCWGTYELQTVTADCQEKAGMHVFDDAYIVDVEPLDEPGDDPDRGSLVVTNLYAETFPMIRYDTRDVSSYKSWERCACGLYSPRINEIFGRSDTMVKLRGINVWAEALGRLATDLPGATGEYFVYVADEGGREEMTVLVEIIGGGDETLAAQLQHRIRQELEVGVRVELRDRDALVELTGRGVSSKPKRFQDRRAKNGHAAP